MLGTKQPSQRATVKVQQWSEALRAHVWGDPRQWPDQDNAAFSAESCVVESRHQELRESNLLEISIIGICGP